MDENRTPQTAIGEARKRAFRQQAVLTPIHGGWVNLQVALTG